jgi:uncharacterized membrane protein YbhN (UPF0104 family)
VHVAILALCLAGIGRHLVGAIAELRAMRGEQGPVAFDYRWLAASVALYTAGLAVLGVPWWLVLAAWGAAARIGQAVRVYLISHVGKYVPGKAMVLVIRCALIRPPTASTSAVVLSSFYETFATMASGSLAAAVCYFLLPAPIEYRLAVAGAMWLPLGIVLLLAGFGTAVLPSVFQFFTKVVTLPFKTARESGETRVPGTRTAVAMALGVLAWTLMGASYLAAINTVSAEPLGIAALPMTTASTAVSIVAGFVSMLPGQVGVRELVLIEALIPAVGRPIAVLASLLFRLITLLTELAIAAVLYFGGRR